jgi:mRNA-degrading endonuclease RelE of RelBE toxin-antitoxin system
VQYRRQSSFDRTYRRLSKPDQQAAEEAIRRLVHGLDTGERTEGLGLKKLQREFWEVRAGLSIRVLFKLEKGIVIFVVVGTHDQIRKYLKHV